jgi:adenylate kinase family enzyme
VTEAKRILVYGVTGSGKTTLARQIGAATGLPWHNADDEIGWEPGWVTVAPGEQRRRADEICRADRWVLDTAYGQWADIVLARAELIVALDYSRLLSLSRLVRRTFMRAADGRPICNGNRETFRTALARDSILVWHFRTFEGKRERMRAWAAESPGPDVLLMARARDTETWLRSLTPPTTPPTFSLF